MVFAVSPYGYSSEIVTLVGISNDGMIVGVKILRQAETPGLGAKVEAAGWAEQFSGLPSDQPLAVDKDGGSIDAIAGATISPRAVTRGVEQARLLFQEMKGAR